MKIPKSLEWKEDSLYLLDQTLLPFSFNFLKMTEVEAVWEAIKSLRVRGAPAISIAGAYGFYLGLVKHHGADVLMVQKKAQEIADYLNSSRPTAVNLQFALKRVLEVVMKAKAGTNVKSLLNDVLNEAHNIYEEDFKICTALGENALPLIQEGMGILTHCNAGAIAVSRYGTALAPLHMAAEKGVKFTVFVDETRPLLQGSRLTAWELMQSGIDVKLITDNMAAWMMSQGKIQMVIVGTDRVVANGDVCNKIGTLSVALAAKYFKIPFYVSCPSTTIDLSTPTGKDIHIEERSAEEVTSIKGVKIAPEGVGVCNPAFDVTPHELVTALITEKGIFPYPYAKDLVRAK
jgi:methylthioribose-1-phosphate isomerase